MILNRFRDQKGNWIPANAAFNGAVAFVVATLRVTMGYRPVAPSISQTAARLVRSRLSPNARIAEFGSGLSTVWFAKHFAEVVSVEHENDWATLVTTKLDRFGLRNVAYLVESAETYESSLDAYPDGYFDLILVDGLKRDLCLRHGLPKLKSGGYIYLDNTDADLAVENGEMRRAETILLNAVQTSGGSIDYFTDFAPINFFAEQGALARIGPPQPTA